MKKSLFFISATTISPNSKSVRNGRKCLFSIIYFLWKHDTAFYIVEWNGIIHSKNHSRSQPDVIVTEGDVCCARARLPRSNTWTNEMEDQWMHLVVVAPADQ